MSSTVQEDLTIEIIDTGLQVGAFDFGIPLIVGQSTESGTPDDQYNVYNNPSSLKEDFSEAGSPRIVRQAETTFSQGASKVAVLNVSSRTPSEGELSTALDNISGKPFFSVCMTSREGTASSGAQGVTGDRADVATWCDTNDRKFFATNNIGETASDMASALENDLQYESTYFLAFENSEADLTSICRPVDAGMAGITSANFPGSINYKFQNIEGIGASDFSATEISTIEGANGNVYLDKLGIAQTSDGVSPNGTFFDISVIKTWLKKRIRENFLELAVNSDKIPYTAAGIEQVKGVLEDIFDIGASEGLIANDADGLPEFDIDTPAIEEITQTQREDRILPDILITARLAGAVNEADLTIRLIA